MNHFSIKKITKQTEFYVFLIIVALSLLIQFRSGQFFTNNNIVDLMRSMVVPSMYAICAFLAFVSTGPDVSFPLIAALSSYATIVISLNIGYKGPVIWLYVLAGVFGLLMGAFNGFILVKYKFPALIVTLGTSAIFSGVLFGVLKARRMELPSTMLEFGKSSILTVKNADSGLGSQLPSTILILVGLYIVTYLVLNYTIVGRGVYAIGGDEVSAERAGFNVKMIRFGVFCANGVVASIAGMTYSSMTQFALPNEFSGAEMTVIAAIILGGTRITGGVGTLKGTLLGTFLIVMVANSLILLGIPVYWQRVFTGLIIIVGTAISVRKSSGSVKKSLKAEVTSK